MKTIRVIKGMYTIKAYGGSFKFFKKLVKSSPDSNYGKHAPARKLKQLWVDHPFESIVDTPYNLS